jgi:serine/threonine-protein kinase
MGAVYVRPFPAVDSGKVQVSTSGGTKPLRSRDGKELFYLDPDGRLMAATVENRGGTLAFSRPELVIETPYEGAAFQGRSYDVSLDGRRFLMVKSAESEDSTASRRIVLVQNWFDELRRLAPSRR